MSNKKLKKEIVVYEPEKNQKKQSLKILDTINAKTSFSKKEADKFLDYLEDLFANKKITKTQLRKYREKILYKVKTSSVTKTYKSYTKYDEEKKIEKKKTQKKVNAKPEEEKKEGIIDKAKKAKKTYSWLKKTGLLRLSLFVFFAIILLLFVTKSSMSLGNHSMFFLVLFVILFIIGKGGEKNLFDDFL